MPPPRDPEAPERWTPGRYRCPVCSKTPNDKRLVVGYNDQTREAWLTCHGGCDRAALLSALGIRSLAMLRDPGSGAGATPAGEFTYVDEHGRPLFKVARWVRPASRRYSVRADDGGWAWAPKGWRRPYVLYRADEVQEAILAGEVVYLCATEADTDAAHKAGEVGTATPEPAGEGGFRTEYAELLRGAKVRVVYDKSDGGRQRAQRHAAALAKHADDVTAWEPAGNSTVTTLRGHLAAGFTLDDLTRLDLAGQAGPTVEALPVDQGAVVLKEVEAFLLRFVVFGSEAQRVAVVLHVVHTWCFEAAETTGYLWVHSPEKQSGKTRLLEVLRQLDRGALMAADMTAAAVYRSITDPAPAILFDEVQELLGRSADDDQRQLRGCLNSGYRLGGAARRCVGDGANQRVEDFPTYCPKVLAGTGTLPDMLADRSIPILLQRKTKSEQVERFRIRRVKPETETLRRRLAGWAQTAIPELEQAEPELPERLSDRQQDCWEALLAIADLAAGDWPQRARRAAVELHGHDPAAEPSVGVLALTHLRDYFVPPRDEETGVTPQPREKAATARLLAYLVSRDDGPWGEWWGKDVDDGKLKGPAVKLARLLKPFEITSTQFKDIDDDGHERKVRGYLRDPLTPVWERYLGTSQVNGQTNTVPPDEQVPSSQASDQQSTDVPSPDAPPGQSYTVAEWQAAGRPGLLLDPGPEVDDPGRWSR